MCACVSGGGGGRGGVKWLLVHFQRSHMAGAESTQSRGAPSDWRLPARSQESPANSLPAAAPTSQMDFMHYHANVSGSGPLGRGGRP